MNKGILTFHFADNYGAVLQAYALQETLFTICKENVEIINYIPQKMKQEATFFSSPATYLKNPILLIKDVLYLPTKIRLKNGFNHFRKTKLNLSKKFCSSEKIEDYFFVVGSDQVWNLSLTNNDLTYYLNIGNENKKGIAYAASIGTEAYEDDHWNKVANYMSNFNRISVREASFAEYLKTKNIVDVFCTLDPTLLCNKEFWHKIEKPRPDMIQMNKKYVLVYVIYYDETVMNIAKNVSKETGYEIVFINNSILSQKGTHNVRCVSPEEFVWLFDNAAYVVTNSFHGTCFSIIFEKDFFVIPHKKRSARMVDLLKTIGLDNYCVEAISKYDTHIDYEHINEKIAKLRNDSLRFLEDALHE